MRKQLQLLFLFVLFSLGMRAQWKDGTSTNNLVCGTSPNTSKFGNVATSDGAGGMIIAWVDSRDSSNKSIYVQRITADGTLKFAQEVLVSNATGAYSSSKTNISITSDSAGGAILVWQDARNTTSTNSFTDLYGQHIDADGNLLWTKDGVRVSLTDNSKSNKGSTIPVLVNKNEFILIFNDNRNGTFDFFAQKIAVKDGAILWKSDASLHGSKPFVQTQAVALSDGKGGAFVVWQDPRQGTTNADIYGQNIDNSGKLLWDTAGLPICTAINQQLTPQLVADGSGGIVVVWSDQRKAVADGNIYAQRINAAGAIQWAKDGVLVCDYTGNQAAPNIVKGGSGFIIGWSDSRKATNDRNIFAQSIDNTGTPIWTAATAGGVPVCQATGAQPIGYTSAQSLKMLPDGSNGAYFVWDDSRNTSSNIDIYGQRLTNNGSVSSGWLADGAPVCNALKNQQSPSVVLDLDNNLVISWNDERDSTNNIYASKLSLSGALSLPIHFITANAVANNNTVKIGWKTAGESLQANYTIEHSRDGINFSIVSSLKSSGNNSYTFIHSSPFAGNNYYRIHATDNLGINLYSQVVKVLFSQSAKLKVSAYPNPVFNSLSLSFESFSKGAYSVRLISSVGNIVKQVHVNIDGVSTSMLDITGLAKGSYLLQVASTNGATVSSQLIFKQ